ncbi:MAG: DUF485 domain-containing protein, partial [Gammaproteobacteria bacterium]|nr:DUF485 domain-containing protein [Gammaproteobacteria bacterium]
MQDTIVEKVLKHPKYAELVRRRTRVSMIFFAVALAIYSGFILTLAYLPEVFAQPLGPGWTMSVGVLTGILVVFSAVIMIALYTYFSNK